MEDMKRVVTQLVERALVYSNDMTYLSPFAKKGSEALSWSYMGGKKDDITVLLGAVVGEEEIEQRSTG